MAVKTFTSGETLTAGDTNTYLANSGLVFVKAQSIVAGSAITTLTNAFSTTYDHYRILVTGLQTSAGQGLAVRMGATATGYYGNMVYALFSASAYTFVPQNNAAFWFAGLTDGSSTSTFSSFDLFQPFLAARTAMNGGYYGRGYSGTFAGAIENTTSYTDFSIFNDSSGTLTGGTITVYGYRKA